MDNINRMKAQIAQRDAIIVAAHEGIISIKDYLTSKKFHGDTSVQVNDVYQRLREVVSDMTDAEFTPYGWACSVRNGRHVQSDACHSAEARANLARD